MNRVIAFFDFDGTITTKDTLLEFIKYCKGDFSFYSGFVLHAPFLVLYKLKLMSNQHAKEMILRYFFGNTDVESFNKKCEEFTRNVVPSLVRQKALTEIALLKEKGAEVVIVSASPENWIAPWCEKLGLKYIATQLDIHNNRLTGKINGLNCHGEEKVRRIQNLYDLRTFSSVYCYGDTPGDRPMLSIGNIRFYKPFR